MSSEERARFGWESDFPSFREAPPARVRERLQEFVTDASPEQIRAWQDSIPPLQREVSEVLLVDGLAKEYSAILEYELPMESRRPDVILLIGAGVLVVELKGKLQPSQADIDQAAAYARDLRCYHSECEGRSVVPVLVPMRAKGRLGDSGGVLITGPDALDELVRQIATDRVGPFIDRSRFLAETAYRPLPTLVKAARELMNSQRVRVIHKASKATEPAIDAISGIIHDAAKNKSRHLILLTGVPGSGKTLVGLRTVHARYLDDLAVPRNGTKPTVPAVFLSGNGPLVEVLQYELKSAGGDGKTFVRGVKDYVKRYSRRASLVPPEHVLVFDEAQRAYDAAMVAKKHDQPEGKSEPEHFIEFAERIPEWCVVIGLIGTGQEIHMGEEAGLVQWRWAVEKAAKSSEWTVHAPPAVAQMFSDSAVPAAHEARLNLDVELRFHAADTLHQFVDELLTGAPISILSPLAQSLASASYHLRITRSLDVAKAYLRERYAEDPDARYGLIASSRDRDLIHHDVPNDFQSTKRLKMGPWYGDPADGPSGLSCRLFNACVTEFGAQGLELDAVLLAWGSDLLWMGDRWSSERAAKYKEKKMVRDAHQLRVNAYRVLLTRGRDGAVVFVPPDPDFDSTYSRLTASGFRPLTD